KSPLLNVLLKRMDLSRVEPTDYLRIVKSYFRWALAEFSINSGLLEKIIDGFNFAMDIRNTVDEATERDLKQKLLDNFSKYYAYQKIPREWLESPKEFIKQFPNHAALRGVKQIIATVLSACDADTITAILVRVKEKTDEFGVSGEGLIKEYEELES